MKRRVLAVCLTMVLLFGVNLQASAESTIKEEIRGAASYIAGMFDTEDPAQYTNDTEVLYLARAGASAEEVFAQYLGSLKAELDATGKLTYKGEESAMYYASASIILAVLGRDATDFYGYNLVEKLEKFDRNTLKSYEIYMLPVILFAVEGYDSVIADKSLKADLIDAIVSQYSESDAGKGFDYWGYSVDTNAKVLCALRPYYSDSRVEDVVNKTAAWMLEQQEDAGFNYNKAQSWNAVNADSTGLGLAFLSEYGYTDQAEKAYQALLTFKGVDNDGGFAYQAGGDSNYFATKDALEGLLCYQRMQQGKKSFYDISDTAVYEYPRVIEKIAALKNITQEDAEKVAQARKAYDALPDDFKKKVTNLDVLIAAEKAVGNVSSAVSSVIISSEPVSEQPSIPAVSSDAIPSASQQSSSKTTSANTTKTSDNSPIIFMFSLLLLSSVGILVFIQKKRDRSYEK